MRTSVRSAVAVTAALALSLALAACDGVVARHVQLSMSFSQMDPHVGQGFQLRVVEVSTGFEVDRITLESIPGPQFVLSSTALRQGESYRVDWYADLNGNRRYDDPPNDHAWRRTLEDVQEAVALNWTHDFDFTALAFPPPYLP